MTINSLHAKLDPRRFPNMSGQMAAILGYLLEQDYTTPKLASNSHFGRNERPYDYWQNAGSAGVSPACFGPVRR